MLQQLILLHTESSDPEKIQLESLILLMVQKSGKNHLGWWKTQKDNLMMGETANLNWCYDVHILLGMKPPGIMSEFVSIQ